MFCENEQQDNKSMSLIYVAKPVNNMNNKSQSEAATMEKYYSFRHENFYTLTINNIEPSDEGKYFCKYYCEECDSLRAELIFTGWF